MYKNSLRIAVIGLVISLLGISACNIQADGTFGNITGPQGIQGIPGTNGTTNLDQAVANSNLTGTVGYRLTWNGTNTVFLPPSFGGSLVYYLNGNVTSDVATYYTLMDTVHNTTHNVSKAVNVGNTTVANFITQPNNPGLTFIPAGSYDVHLHALQTGSKSTFLTAEIWETSSNGTDIGLIGTTEATPPLTTSQLEYDIVFVTSNVYALNSTASRIDLRIIATAGAGSATTVYIDCGGTADSHISLPGTQVTINNFVPYTGAINALNMDGHNITSTTNTSTARLFISDTVTPSIYSYAANSTTVFTIKSSGYMNFIADNSNLYMQFNAGFVDVYGNAIRLRGTGKQIYPGTGVAGYSVVPTSFNTGTLGTLIIPSGNMSGAASNATRDTLAGNVNGAIAVDNVTSNGTFYFWVRVNGGWYSMPLNP